MSNELSAWARDLVRCAVPFKPHGRTREGLDCWGVVWLGFTECLGYNIPSYTEEYTPKDLYDFEKLEDIIGKYMPGWTEVTKHRAGDVVLMRLAGRPIHVGLVIENGVMLHIEERINLCVEKYGSPLWKNRIVGVYRFNPGQ